MIDLGSPNIAIGCSCGAVGLWSIGAKSRSLDDGRVESANEQGPDEDLLKPRPAETARIGSGV
jgi:hypothetical protein